MRHLLTGSKIGYFDLVLRRASTSLTQSWKTSLRRFQCREIVLLRSKSSKPGRSARGLCHASMYSSMMLHPRQRSKVNSPHYVGRDALARFLEYDRQVLRFFATEESNGTLFRRYACFIGLAALLMPECSIHFFLMDHTVEVAEDRKRQCDQSIFPMVLKRMAVSCWNLNINTLLLETMCHR